jgi:catabolite regulation protein CreA
MVDKKEIREIGNIAFVEAPSVEKPILIKNISGHFAQNNKQIKKSLNVSNNMSDNSISTKITNFPTKKKEKGLT